MWWAPHAYQDPFASGANDSTTGSPSLRSAAAQDARYLSSRPAAMPLRLTPRGMSKIIVFTPRPWFCRTAAAGNGVPQLTTLTASDGYMDVAFSNCTRLYVTPPRTWRVRWAGADEDGPGDAAAATGGSDRRGTADPASRTSITAMALAMTASTVSTMPVTRIAPLPPPGRGCPTSCRAA